MMSAFHTLMTWFGFETDSDKHVSLRGALSMPPVWYAHRKITGDVGRIPIDVKKRVGRGYENDIKHDGYRLLREQPNKIQSPSVFKEQVTSHAIMYGNGRAAIIRNEFGGIDELIPMMPDRTWTCLVDGEKYHVTRPDGDDKQDMFTTFPTLDSGVLVFHDDDVLHIPGFSFNGIEGIGLLQIAQSTFSAGINSQKFVNTQLKHGFRGKLFLEVPPGQMREESKAKEFLEAFNASEGGSDNAGKAAMLREGIKANALSMSNNDAQFIELQKFNRQDVGLLFGIDAMPGDGESVSYNSLEQKKLAYLDGVDVWFVKWEEQCDIKLRTPTQKRLMTHYFKCNRAALLRTDLTATMTAFVQARGAKIMSANECREKLDLNPYEGGDEYDNPAITPGGVGESQDAKDDTKSEPKENKQNTMAIDETLRSLIKREARNAISGCKASNFVSWIDRNYGKWESKLADKLESIGLDRDNACVHCKASKQMLLEVAGQSTADTLEANVRDEVGRWGTRYTKLKGI